MALNGEQYYRAAIALTDAHPGKRFCDMLAEDSLCGPAFRKYFIEDFGKLELFGWNTFCEKMRDDGQKDWLAKINALDDGIMLSFLERQILTTAGSGGREERAALEGAVKALQGLASAAKIQAEAEASSASIPRVEVVFLPSRDKPAEPKVVIPGEKAPSKREK